MSAQKPHEYRKYRVVKPLTLACLLFVHACSIQRGAATTPCAAPARITEVAGGVFVRGGQHKVVFEADRIANIGFVVGGRCVAVIDTGGSVDEGRALDCAIRSVTERPVCYVINTHVHPDHLLGNAAFDRAGVEFVGHVKLSRALALRGDTYLERARAYDDRIGEAPRIVFPERSVTGVVQLDIGERVLTVRAHASAHTDHDISVVDEVSNTAFLGDLVFLEHLPVIDGSINGWIDELDALTGISVDYVVPGHGPVHAAWPSAAKPTMAYLTELRVRVRDWIAGGGNLASAQDTIELFQPDRWLLLDRYHRRNIGSAFAELEWED